MEKALQVFLIYAREDRQKVEALYRKLLKAGFNPWMDVRNIRGGEEWASVIRKAIRESDFVLVCLSKNAINARGYIQKEIKSTLAVFGEQLESNTYIIPVRLEDSEVPESLKDFQWVDIFEEDGANRLIRALKFGVARRAGEVTRFRESIEEEKREKPKSHLFVAMPFSPEMEDRYYYGIQRAADAKGYACERVDKDSFTGDILERIKVGIETSVAVVADLTGANPNVYLEVGYAWGKKIPTILLLQDGHELKFDVQGQRCLKYNSIKSLEESLTRELEKLRSKGGI